MLIIILYILPVLTSVKQLVLDRSTSKLAPTYVLVEDAQVPAAQVAWWFCFSFKICMFVLI